MPKVAVKTVEEPHAFDRESLVVKWLPVKVLFIKWPSAQRKLESENHAKRIAAEFDPDMFGFITVTLPDDRGQYHVIDGFNRVTAIRMMWGDDEQVPCQILPVRDPVRAAQIFMGFNKGRKSVSPLQSFKVSVTAGHPDAVAINKIVRSAGYRVGSDHADGCVSAVGALGGVYRKFGPDVLTSALQLIQATWGLDGNAVQGPIISGYGLFMANYGDKANWGRVKETIQKRFTPGRFLGAARTLREVEACDLSEAVMKVLTANYNRGLKSGQLKQ
jgi:hypothetical protein